MSGFLLYRLTRMKKISDLFKRTLLACRSFTGLFNLCIITDRYPLYTYFHLMQWYTSALSTLSIVSPFTVDKLNPIAQHSKKALTRPFFLRRISSLICLPTSTLNLRRCLSLANLCRIRVGFSYRSPRLSSFLTLLSAMTTCSFFHAVPISLTEAEGLRCCERMELVTLTLRLE